MGKHHAGKHIKIFTCGMYISSFSRNLAKENKKQLNKEGVKQTKNSLCPGIKTEGRKNVAPMMGCFSFLLSSLLRAIDHHLTGFFERLLMV